MPRLRFSIETRSRRDLAEALDRYGRRAQTAIAKALYREAEGIMAQSKELVPVDTGALRSSGHVRVPELRDRSATVVLGYGGPAAPYALYVHEDLNAFHKVGMAKYLEVPFRAAQGGMAERIARDLRDELS